MKPKRFTRNIHYRQDYCEFEVKNCPYKDIYGLEKYSELEENVDCDLSIAIDKLGQLEDIEQELGVDLISFLKEMNHVIKNSSQTVGYTTSGKKITTDYGCVEDFLKQLKESLKQ